MGVSSLAAWSSAIRSSRRFARARPPIRMRSSLPWQLCCIERSRRSCSARPAG